MGKGHSNKIIFCASGPTKFFIFKILIYFFLNRQQWGQWVHRSGEKGQRILEGLKDKKVLVLFAQVTFEWE